jgi:E3 ubiquitin-protein ligase HUWE1
MLTDFTDNLEEVNQRWRSIVALNIRITMLSDLYSTAGYSHSRGSASLLQALICRGTPDVITGLGDLHRACVWESIVFKNGVGVKDSDPSMPSFLRLPTDGQTDDNSRVRSPFGIPTTENPTPDADPVERVLSNSVGENSSPSKPVKGKDTPRSLNIKALSHALNQIPSSLTPLFQCAISLFFFSRFRKSHNSLQPSSSSSSRVVLQMLAPNKESSTPPLLLLALSPNTSPLRFTVRSASFLLY